MNQAVDLCLRGEISAQVAVSRMLLGGLDAAAIASEVASVKSEAPKPAWQALNRLLVGRAAELNRLAAEIRQTASDHTAMGGVASIAAFFDRAVQHSPEAGVALYSLGDAALLDEATAEITNWLIANRLLTPGADVLDLGCGIGRIAAAIAPQCRSVLGLDVSPGMVAEAQRRHPDTSGLQFDVSDGGHVPPGPFNLVLLVDSMPYVLQAGLADAVVAAVAAALRPGAALVVLNLSYGRSPETDRNEAQRWADQHEMALSITRPFSLWDAPAYVFVR